MKKKVFIVHGHDNEAKVSVARLVEGFGLEAIILHEQSSMGQTIIEKLERYSSDVDFAIVLYTACDVGNSKIENYMHKRARQNVVFEHGYLIGKLGRNKVCALVEDEVELPGDNQGVLYIPLNENDWKYKVADEMNSAGITVDKNTIK